MGASLLLVRLHSLGGLGVEAFRPGDRHSGSAADIGEWGKTGAVINLRRLIICLSLPKTSSPLEILAVRWIISHSARSSGSSFFERRSLAPSFARLLRLLSQLSPASGIGEELANSTRGRRAGEGQGHLNSASRRVASLLPTSRLTLAIRLTPSDIDRINGGTAGAG